MPALALPDPPLGDGTIALRPFTALDVPWVAAACAEPLVARFTFVPEPYGEREARAWIGGQAAERERGAALELAIADAATGEGLGAVDLAGFAWPHARGEIGYWVAPAARGRGVATRAVALLARHGFEALGLARIEILAFAANRASQRVAERAGFRREGLLRSYLAVKGRREDVIMFARLRGDPPA
jgi:RimJ/RimL family protein N-acetyltransferase